MFDWRDLRPDGPNVIQIKSTPPGTLKANNLTIVVTAGL